MYQLSGQVSLITSDETLQVIRESNAPGQGVTYVDGKPVHTGGSVYLLTCNVQPMSGQDLLLVPEGDRFTDQMWLYTNNVTRMPEAEDLVIRDGQIWQIQEVDEWGSYSRARMQNVDPGMLSASAQALLPMTGTNNVLTGT